MKLETIRIRGRAWLTLEAVATCYEVEVTFVQEIVELGLLGPSEPAGSAVESTTAIEVAMLDRLGTIVRLHRQQGINPAGIARIFEDPGQHP